MVVGSVSPGRAQHFYTVRHNDLPFPDWFFYPLFAEIFAAGLLSIRC
jgi:hypothetical protein